MVSDRDRQTGSTLSPGRAVDRQNPCSDLLNVHPADGPSDDQPLDLRGPLEDGVDLRVPVPALDRVVADVAVAAEDLNGLLGDPHGVLAGVELGHGALAV